MIIHIVTEHFSPERGGLEIWTFRFARALERIGHHVIVHVCGISDRTAYEGSGSSKEMSVKFLAADRALWEQPLTESGWSGYRFSSEQWRLRVLILKNSICREMVRFADDKHVVISNFIIGMGFLACMVTNELNIPHIACVVGTDFSRGFYNPHERQVLEAVVKQASAVVTVNEEQRRAICRELGTTKAITIHFALGADNLNREWKPRQNKKVALFSDGGYSHKKGTQVLLWCFGQLHDEGIPVSLTLCGPELSDQSKYWTDLRKTYEQRYRADVDFRGFLDQATLQQILSESNLYCSATLGEGCSLSRTAALCTGIPIVTTRCGEIVELAADASHVRLASPGDAQSFLSELKGACLDVMSGRIFVDSHQIEQWRLRFTPEREIDAWGSLLTTIA